jgi:hypothetical protein
MRRPKKLRTSVEEGRIEVVIQIETGPESGKRVTLRRGDAVKFGRGAKADIALPYDDLLSGLHFAVEFDDRGCRVRDLGSRNGTRLNGAPVKEAALRSGDYILAGDTGFAVSFVAEAPPPRPEAPRATPAPPPSSSATPAQVAPVPSASALAGLKPVSEEKWRDLAAESRAAAATDAAAYGAEAPPVDLLAFLRGQQPLYAILDGARDARIISLLREYGYESAIPQTGRAEREEDFVGEPGPAPASQQKGSAAAPPRGGPEPAAAPADAATPDEPAGHAEDWKASLTPEARAYLAEQERKKHQIQSLYNGYSALELEVFAPYLVRLGPDSPLLETLVQLAWGKSWGILLKCDKPFAEVRRHLRKFLLVEMPDGKKVYFRFYDPRVLRVFLPSCKPPEAREFLGPIAALWAEAETPGNMHQFEWDAAGQKLAAAAVALNVEAPVASGA